MIKLLRFTSLLILLILSINTSYAQMGDENCLDGTSILIDGDDAIAGDNSLGTGQTEEDFSVMTGCDAELFESSVWFTFEPVNNGTVQITIDDDGSTFGDLAIVIVDQTDCELLLDFFCGDFATEIDGQTINLYCDAIAGNMYSILIGSETANAGTFEIAAESIANDVNDECDDALTLPTVTCNGISSQDPVVITAACPDAEATCNMAGTEPAVWFELPIDPAVPFFDVIGNDFELFEGTCGSLTSLGCSPIEGQANDPAMSYYILATAGASWEASPTYEPQPSDECANAMPVGTGNFNSFTICQTADHNECGGGAGDTDEQTIWFQYTTGVNEDVTISVSEGATNPVTDLSIAIFDGCGGAIYDDGDADPDDALICGAAFDTETILNCVPAGTTLFIAIGSSNDGEGEFTLNISATAVAADNDACDDAITLSMGNNPDLNNECGSPDIELCDPDESESSVWYSYEITSPITEITFDLSNGDIIDPNWAVYSGSCGGLIFEADECSGAQIVLTCPPLGILYIQVASPLADAGTFEIDVTEGAPSAANDICDDAEDAGNLPDDCTPATIAGTTVNSCPENVAAGGCDLTVLSTVWHQFTAPAGTVELQFTINTPAQFTLWNGCPESGGMFFAPECFDTDTDFTTGPGTYWISASHEIGSEGDFEFEVLAVVPPANDLCGDAIELSTGSNGGLTNLCASDVNDVQVGGCGAGPSAATVWYSYEITDPIAEITIDLAGTGTAINVPVIAAYDACGGAVLGEDCNGSSINIPCPPVGVLSIQVGSTFDNAGEFEITITEGDATPDNDVCDGATDEGELPVCEPQTISGDNEGACPESFGVGGCNIDTEATVWHEIEVPAGAVQLLIDNVMGNVGITIWDACEGTAFGPVCISNDEEVNVPSGGTYFISVNSPDGAEGPYSFDITAIVPPDNDLCANAETATAGTTSGTNICATADFILPCQGGTQDVVEVWYEYIVPAGVKAISVNITAAGGSPISGDIFSGVFTDCGGTLFDGNSFTCAGEEMNIICPDEGTSLFISVGSLADEAGDFDLIIEEENPTCTYDNDECADAEDIGEAQVSSGEICLDGCNELACPDDLTCGETNNVVWFTFTTEDFDPAIETFLLINVNDEDNFDPIIQLFDGCGGGAISACADNLNLSNLDFPIDPNTQYWIAVGNEDPTLTGGEFEVCVDLVQGCSNDDCDTAIALPDGATVIGNTENCTLDILTGCTPATQSDASVWYTYTVPPGITAFTVEVNGGAPDLSVQWVANIDCGNAQGDMDDNGVLECDANAGPFTQTCVTEGEVYSFLLSNRPPQNPPTDDFEITVTGLEPGEPGNPSPDNDTCDGAISFDLPTDCTPIDVSVSNVDACPEPFAVGGGCDIDVDATVWYSAVLPAGAAGLEFVDISTGANIAVFEGDCGNPVFVECVTEGDADLFVNAVPGATYFFAVSSPQELDDHSFSILAVVPPPNDTACDTGDFPHQVIASGGGSFSGTTCCAIGFNDGGADFQNQDCGGASDDNSVWFGYTYSGAGDAIEVTASVPGTGIWSLEVYLVASPSDACGGLAAQNVWSSCDASMPVQIGCPDPDQYYLIKLTSSDDGCGDYTINVEEIAATCSDFADDCEDVTAVLTPVTPDDFSLNYFCMPSCLEFACPEDPAIGCGEFATNPTVWMSFTADDAAVQIFTTVETSGSWSPVWTIYGSQAGDCSDLELIATGGSPPCSDGDNTPDLHTVAAEDVYEQYFVAISANDNDVIDDPNFEFCVATTVNAIICLGELGEDCGLDATIEVIDREFGGDLEGPFCPGEEVEVCVDFFYDATDSGADWLMGVIPTFGDGWDLQEFDPVADAPAGSEWIEEGGMCEPILQEPVPHLCTFENADGNLTLCNSLCDVCPCAPGMEEGDNLPSGWFWITPGGGAGCLNDCSPGEAWGIGSTTSQINFCMTLVVKTFDSVEECLAANDLTFSFQTFSDGVAGCWEDPLGECLLDLAQFGPSWEVDCNVSPPAEAEPVLICSGDEAGVQVTIEGGLNGDIIIMPDPDKPTAVEGLGEHEFSGGSGIIDDILENCSSDIDSAHYIAFAIVEGFNCPGLPTQIAVPVVPKLEPDPEEVVVCLPFSVELDAMDQFTGGAPGFSYQWFENGTDLIGTDQILNFDLTINTEFIELHVTFGQPEIECFEIVTIDITVFEALTPEAFNEDEVSCFGEGCVSYSLPAGQIVNDDEWTIYDWKGEEFDDGGGETYCFDDDTPPGIYTAEIFVENDGGCIGMDTVTYVELAIPEFTITQEILGECDEIILCIDFYCGEDPEDDECEQGADCNEDGLPDIYDALDQSANINLDADGNFVLDGVPAFISVEWNGFNIVPVGGFGDDFELNQLCFTATTSGNFEAVIEGPGGCIGMNNVDVEIGNDAILDDITDQSVCEGDEISIMATPNDPNFVYTWTLSTDPDNPVAIGNPGVFTPTVAGTYVLTVEDPNGCPASDAFDIAINALPVGDIADGSLCVGSSFEFCAPGDPATWTYSWMLGGVELATSQCFTVLGTPADQVFTVSWTDENGCSSSDDFTVASEALIDLGNTDQFACTDEAISVPFDVPGFMEYEWTDPNGMQVSTTSDVLALETGVYTLTFTDGNCPGQATLTVIPVEPPPSMTFDNAPACNVDNGGPIGTCVDLLALANTGGTWTLDPAFDPATTDLANVCFDNLAPADYVFTFTTNTAVAPCEDISTTFTVNVSNCSCNADVMDPSDFCEGDGTFDLNTLYFSTTDPGVWSAADPIVNLSGSILDLTGLAAGDYEFVHTADPTGMSPCSDNIILTIVGLPVLELGTPVSPCSSGADGPSEVNINDVIITGVATVDPASLPAGADYDPVDNVIDFDGVPMGSYTITLVSTDATAPCENISVPLTIEVQDCDCPEPDFFDPPTLCNAGGQYDLDDLFEGPSFDGTWSVLDEPAGSNLMIGAGNVIDQTDLLLGDYVLQFVINNPDPGCPSVFEVGPLVIIAQPVAGEGGEDLVCLNEDVSFDLATLLTGADDGGVWTEISAVPSSGSAFDPVAGAFNSNGQAAGTYTFQYEIVVAAPCESVSTIVEIEIEGLPSVEAGSAGLITCDNPNITIGSVSGTASGIGIEYSWTEINDPTLVLGTDIELTVSQPGQYILEVIDQTTGCRAIDMVTITADTALPTFDVAVEDPPCFGDNAGSIAFVNVQGGGGDFQFSFDGGQTFGSESVLENLGPGDFDLVLMDANGCLIPTSVTISEPALVTVDAGEDVGIATGEANTLSFTTNVPIEEIVLVEWTDDDGNVVCSGPPAECMEIAVTPATTTTYTVAIETIAGCRANDNVRLNISVVRDCYPANVIHLDSEMNNEIFFLVCDEFAEEIVSMIVYDRWGNKVFDAESIPPNSPGVGWDGTYRGRNVVPGVYVYVIQVKFIDDDVPVLYSGDLTVIE